MAAIFAAKGGRSVLLLEAAKDVGRKILISGGGRCNVLPMEDSPPRFVSESPSRLVRRFLDRWKLDEQRLFFEALLGGALREEPEAKKLFPPSNRAKDVRDALRRAAEEAAAVLRAGAPVRDVTKVGDGFRLALDGEVVIAKAVILTTGGRSVLGGGADARGFDWVQALGHTVRETYPALAPLVGGDPSHVRLSGVSLPAKVWAEAGEERASSEGGFLFTHRGWSGPSVLDVSHVVERAVLAGRRPDVRVCFPAGFEENEKRFASDDKEAGGTGGAREGKGVHSAGFEENRSSNGPERSGTGSRSGGASASATAASRWDDALRASSGLSLSSLLRKKLPDRLVSLILETAKVSDCPLSRLSREDRRRVVSALTEFPLPVTGTEGYRTAEVTGGGVALEEVDPGSGRSRIVPGL